MLSHCRVRLYHKNIEEPIWDLKFDAPADHILKGAYGRDKTVFGNSKYRFWEEFFVPVSTWAASQSRIKSLSWLEPVKNIHVRGDRAAVLLERGAAEAQQHAVVAAAPPLDERRGAGLAIATCNI